jgi:hypothetical protein
VTIPDPTYITVDEVQENSLVTGLKDDSAGVLGDADITKLIQHAEAQIDAYCGKQEHHPYDGNLDRVFPRAQDYSVVVSNGLRYEYPRTPVIPLDVSTACLRQVEFLYLQWWPNRETAQPTASNHAVEQEAAGGDGSYSATYSGGGTDLTAASLCDQAKVLLTGYRSRWAPLGTTDVRTSPAPRVSC